MTIVRMKPGRLAATLSLVAIAAAGLAGCSGEVSDVDRAQAQVSAKEKALTEAQDGYTTAVAAFCVSAEEYIEELDRYGDVLTDTAPTVGDVRAAGEDLVEPGDEARDAARAAASASAELASAEAELASAQAELEAVQAGATAAPSEPTAAPSPTPLAPAATVERVEQAEADFAETRDDITDETPLAEASEQFNAAAVALELSWLRLFADAGCLTDDQRVQAEAAVAAYTTALQQDLTTAGFYTGTVDGVYGPLTVQAVEALQSANDLPMTGTMDAATTAALQAELAALGATEAQESVASTAAVQQTLKLVGFWDGPVDGEWTPELTGAVMAFQTELGVEPTGTMDAATIAAFEKAIAELTAGEAPTPSPTATS